MWSLLVHLVLPTSHKALKLPFWWLGNADCRKPTQGPGEISLQTQAWERSIKQGLVFWNTMEVSQLHLLMSATSEESYSPDFSIKPSKITPWLTQWIQQTEIWSLTLGPAFPGKPSSPFSPRSPCREHKRLIHKLLCCLCSPFAVNGEEYFNSAPQDQLEGVNGAIWE